METWPTKGVHIWAMALWKSERYTKLRHVDAHQKIALPSLEGDWNQRQVDLCAHLKWTWTWSMK